MNTQVRGQVVQIEPSGDLRTDITEAQIADQFPPNATLKIVCDAHETFGIHSDLSSFEPQTFVAFWDDQTLCLKILGENTAALLGTANGAAVTVSRC